ncbi:MAG: lysophospholipid acyltransferase family protein [Acidobacteriaceae bacterium]
MSLPRTPRRIYRLLALAAVFVFSILEVLITRPRTRALRAAWLSRIGNRLLRTQDITFTTIGPIPTHGAVISNHLTYVDIIIHASIRPCVFVSKIELRSTPVFGWVSMMAGTIYIDRSAGRSAMKSAEGMAKGFRDALPVVFFPEGTTGVGDTPCLPFRSGLLSLALAANQPITAGFIHYDLTPRDLARGKSTRNDVHWGSQTLLQHLWNFADLNGVHGTIQFAPQPIAFSEAALHNRKLAGREAQAAVESLAIPIQQPTPSTDTAAKSTPQP